MINLKQELSDTMKKTRKDRIRYGLFTTIFIILLSFSVSATAKPTLLTNIEKVLIKKDVQKLNQYGDSLENSSKRINVFWNYFREIVPGFNEGVFYVKKYTPKKGYTNIANELAYRISIVTFDSTIIYYKLGEVITDYEGNGEQTYKHKRTYTDDTAFVLLCNTFKSMFNKPLNMNELFDENFRYGHRCGIDGVDPKPRIQMNEFVKNNRKDSLIHWLQSTNTEKQIYAVEGLYELNKTGVQLTADEKQMAMYVKAKKGTINYCVGCLITNIGVFEAVKKIFKSFPSPPQR